CQQGYTYPWTF
nr:immunoglobulin light chain junction region [Macaca mulatta]